VGVQLEWGVSCTNKIILVGILFILLYQLSEVFAPALFVEDM
jgi:hypothetical protein